MRQACALLLGVAVGAAGCGRVGYDPGQSVTAAVDSGVVEADAEPPPSCTGALPVPPTGVVTGSTVEESDDYSGTCGGDEAPDVVYQVRVAEPVEGLLAATDLPGSDYASMLYLRDGCGEDTEELACDRFSGIRSQAAMIRTAPLAAGTYYLFIDGRSPGREGTYEASIQLLMGQGRPCDPAPGLLRCAPGLACTPAGDGHSCQLAGCQVTETFTSDFLLTGSTAGRDNVHASTCGLGGDGGVRAPESIYVLELDTAVSNVEVSTDEPGTDYDTLIYVRDGCDGPEIACDDDGGGFLESRLDTGPLPPGAYYIFIDGFAYESGAYELRVTITP